MLACVEPYLKNEAVICEKARQSAYEVPPDKPITEIPAESPVELPDQRPEEMPQEAPDESTPDIPPEIPADRSSDHERLGAFSARG